MAIDMEMYALNERRKKKHNICGYIVFFMQKTEFLHNHICSRSKDVLSKEGKILMACGDNLFS